jgi:cell wall-associated NlpC family hydrolase
MTKQLSDIIGGGMTPEKMNDIMVASGLDYDSEKKVWFAKTDDAKYEKPAEAPVADDSAVSAPESKQSFWQSAATAAGAAWDAVKNSASAVGGFLGGLFKKPSDIPVIEAEMLNVAEITPEEAARRAEMENAMNIARSLNDDPRMATHPAETTFAKTQLGLVGGDYIFGGENPYNKAEGGVDCSGAVQFGLLLQGYDIKGRLNADGFINTYTTEVTDGTIFPGDIRAMRDKKGVISHIQTLIGGDMRVNPTGDDTNVLGNPGTVNLLTSTLPKTGEIRRLDMNQLKKPLYYNALRNIAGGKLSPGQLDRAWEQVLKYSYSYK